MLNGMDGARVLLYTAIDSRHQPTGNCRHTVDGRPLDPVNGLAICQYEGQAGFYLFYCDSDWRVLTDTYHDTLEGAKNQAEFEYVGVKGTWESLA